MNLSANCLENKATRDMKEIKPWVDKIKLYIRKLPN